jgi:hypothetical protein
VSNQYVRNESGVGLVATMSVAVIASFWMLATAAMVMPAMHEAALERSQDVLRNACESSLDWAVNEYNSSSIGSIDTTPGVLKTSNVPSSVLPSGFTGSIQVGSMTPPAYSYLSAPYFDPNQTGIVTTDVNFRTITATVFTPSHNLSKSIEVILMPVQELATTDAPVTSTSVIWLPFFQDAFGSKAAFAASGNITTNSFNSETDPNGANNPPNRNGNIGSNTSIALSGNSNIGGEVGAFPTSSKGNAVSMSGIVTVGNGNGSSPSAVSSSGASAVGIQSNGGISQSGIITVDGSSTADGQFQQMTFPPAPAPPANLPTVPFPSGSNITLSQSGSYGNQSISGNTNVTITAGGSYSFTGFSASGNTTITISPNVTTPVNIFITGGTGGFQMSGNSQLNNSLSANMLRIWDSESGTISLSGNNATHAVIYAPNANFTKSGNGAIVGSVMADTVSVSGNTTFTYDESLATAGATFSVTTTSVVNDPTQTQVSGNYQVVSWLEL